MAGFLVPTRRKLRWTALGLLALPGCLLLRAIPVQWDVLDLRQLGDLVLGLLLGAPIRAFDAVTGSAFAAGGDGFLRLPSLAELGFALGADALLFYVLACGVLWWRERRPAAVAGRSPGSRSA